MTAGRTVVTNEDVAIFLLLLRFFSENMNTDGSMPVRRWKKMWQALFEAGDINRAFCPQRFKVIRDHLSSLQLLDWQDETYRIGWFDEDGEYHKGKSSKWHASERLMGMLQGTVRWSPKAGPGTGEFKLELGAAGWPRPCSWFAGLCGLHQAACCFR